MDLRIEKRDLVGFLKDETGIVRGLWFPDSESAQNPTRIRAVLAVAAGNGEIVGEEDREASVSGRYRIEPAEEIGGFIVRFPSAIDPRSEGGEGIADSSRLADAIDTVVTSLKRLQSFKESVENPTLQFISGMSMTYHYLQAVRAHNREGNQAGSANSVEFLRDGYADARRQGSDSPRLSGIEAGLLNSCLNEGKTNSISFKLWTEWFLGSEVEPALEKARQMLSAGPQLSEDHESRRGEAEQLLNEINKIPAERIEAMITIQARARADVCFLCGKALGIFARLASSKKHLTCARFVK